MILMGGIEQVLYSVIKLARAKYYESVALSRTKRQF